MAETVYTNIGALYYLNLVSITVSSGNKYKSLPLNSTFNPNLGSTFYVTLLDSFGNRKSIYSSDLTFSGYDMSTAGFQEVTVTYNSPNGQVLTDTFTLHVYGATTWRTIWSGNEEIKFGSGGYFYINDVQGVQYNQRALTTTSTEEVLRKYVGWEGARRLRISYTLSNINNADLFIIGNNERPINTTAVNNYEFDFDLNGQTTSTVYNTILNSNKFLIINKTSGDTKQLIYGRLSETDDSSGHTLLRLQYSNNKNALYTSDALLYQTITITRIQVLE